MYQSADEGHSSLGWVHYPEQFDVEEFEKIKLAATKVQKDNDVLLVIGIGGSYLGARAAIEMLSNSFSKEQRAFPQILFVGHNLSTTYLLDVINQLQDKDFSINVISKSGTTLEPAIAFRIFRKLLEDKYGKEQARKRIFVTTDPEQGKLKILASVEGYETFTIPNNIGGRFSVLTSVGLFPMAVSGIQIDDILKGAQCAKKELNEQDVTKNAAYQYATIRNLLYNDGKIIELLVTYECRNFITFQSGGNSYLLKAKEKTKKEFFLLQRVFPPTLHSLASTFKKVYAYFLKQLFWWGKWSKKYN